jgi:proline iminopeptidase
VSAGGAKPLRTYYPPIEPYRTGRLRVSGVHELYFEECGNPDGRPIVFLHGGPGLGIDPNHRRFFDPAAYRIVLFDQRGCGKSTPHASLVDNTTWHLVGDIEALRVHLGVERWHVFGGSWGSTLALAYAETHPGRVSALILRGIFLLRPQEIAWFYQRGTDALFPDAFEQYVAPIPVEERGDLVSAFYRRLTSEEPAVRLEAAKAWSVWEGTTSTLLPNPRVVEAFAGDDFAIAFARIECHYFMHRAWLDPPRDLLGNAGKIRHIPGFIVQGRYDVVCPMESAWALHRAWPEAEFHVTADGGHAASEPGNLSALVDATDRFAHRTPESERA